MKTYIYIISIMYRSYFSSSSRTRLCFVFYKVQHRWKGTGETPMPTQMVPRRALKFWSSRTWIPNFPRNWQKTHWKRWEEGGNTMGNSCESNKVKLLIVGWSAGFWWQEVCEERWVVYQHIDVYRYCSRRIQGSTSECLREERRMHPRLRTLVNMQLERNKMVGRWSSFF